MIGEHKHGLERELALAVVEEIFEAWPEQVDHHHIVVALDAEPMHIWNAHCKNEKSKNRFNFIEADRPNFDHFLGKKRRSGGFSNR